MCVLCMCVYMYVCMYIYIYICVQYFRQDLVWRSCFPLSSYLQYVIISIISTVSFCFLIVYYIFVFVIPSLCFFISISSTIYIYIYIMLLLCISFYVSTIFISTILLLQYFLYLFLCFHHALSRRYRCPQESPASKRGQDKHSFCRSAAIYHNYDIIMALLWEFMALL